MNINKARRLKPGDTIRYPEDMGAPAGRTTVVSANLSDAIENRNVRDEPYIWVHTDKGVWPSNRL